MEEEEKVYEEEETWKHGEAGNKNPIALLRGCLL